MAQPQTTLTIPRPETEQAPAADPLPLPSHKICGLDSLRFLCALVVVLDHLGIVGFTRPPHVHGLTKILWTIQDHISNGPAAVIVFFVISGFVIHKPADGRPFHLPSFYARRMLRIIPPALVVFCLRRYLFQDFRPVITTSLWSIICETLYYAIYPLLRPLGTRFGWARLTLAAYAVSLATAFSFRATHRDAITDYTASGLVLTPIIGLCCWVVGCWLRENYTRFAAPSTRNIWTWRAAIFLGSVLLRIVKFHGHGVWAGNSLTLTLASPFVVVWIAKEIRFYQRRPPVAWLEHAGQYTYSLYLVHELVLPAIALAGFGVLAQRNFLTHTAVLLVILPVTLAFYWLVEYSSHRIAQRTGSALRA